MSGNRFYLLVILSLLAILGFLTFQIMRPFFTAIGWSVVFSIVFYPVYAFISRHVRVRALAAAVTLMLLVVVIAGPLAYLTVVLFKELQVLAAMMDAGSLGTVKDFVDSIRSSKVFVLITSSLGLENSLTDAVFMENVRNFGKQVLQQVSTRIPDVLSVFVDLIFMLFTTFFFLKDGTEFLSKAQDYLPFSDVQKRRLASQVKDMVVSTVYGGVIIAIIQGILGGAAYAVIGIESPVLWGTAMSIMSFVPLLGTFAIWGPTAGYLVFQGDYIHGIGLFLFGVFVISMVDNILKPLIIGTRTKMPTVIILFSVLGGIRLFGMIGLIMGPLIIAIFISVFELFKTMEGVEGQGPSKQAES